MRTRNVRTLFSTVVAAAVSGRPTVRGFVAFGARPAAPEGLRFAVVSVAPSAEIRRHT